MKRPVIRAHAATDERAPGLHFFREERPDIRLEGVLLNDARMTFHLPSFRAVNGGVLD
jgi:hypothetical protein